VHAAHTGKHNSYRFDRRSFDSPVFFAPPQLHGSAKSSFCLLRRRRRRHYVALHSKNGSYDVGILRKEKEGQTKVPMIIFIIVLCKKQLFYAKERRTCRK
jgi:hypothetical protein